MPLYYECHITIEPVLPINGDRFEYLSRIASSCGFRIADLLMQKRPEDTAERSKYDTFMTSHSDEFWKIENNLKLCMYKLREAGFKAWRYKIEAVNVDSRHSDTYGFFNTEDP